MKLIVTSFVTLDGVIEGPGWDEHRDGRNAWALRIQNEEDEDFNQAMVGQADALLLGRKTWQIWAAFWPTAEGAGELAERLNGIPKYVVSRTLRQAEWNNSHVISGDVPSAIRDLKSTSDGVLMVFGSADLVDLLLQHDLVDEWRIQVYPVILGSGKKLFRDGADTHHLRLIGSRTFSSGVVALDYVPERVVPSGPYVEDFAWTDEQVRSLQAAQNAGRVLATVLFTDVVDSTGRAAQLGDRAWRELLDRHDAVARTEVHRWMGQNAHTTGDGIMATFDTPTRALRCAFALLEALDRLDLEVRAGIHTGEVELRDGGVGGIGVHIAARVTAEAGAGEVVVTRTVRDLATGTDLLFSARGSASLRGVPGEWELYRASLT